MIHPDYETKSEAEICMECYGYEKLPERKTPVNPVLAYLTLYGRFGEAKRSKVEN